ncbi:MAG: ABC transporter permease [Lachnospiraceae bacterium]|nr:ABC transporter permease [Lachnospiraceae bacterium]
MKIFCKFTIKSLLANKTRTLVTIIGIMLSMSLFTAVLEGAYSGMKYLQRSVVAMYGNWHGLCKGVYEEEKIMLENDPGLCNVDSLGIVGFGEIGSENEYKPYLFVTSLNDTVENRFSINLIEGRMPLNSTEIVISNHLYTNGNVKYKVGDRINIDLGQRNHGDYELDAEYPYREGETLKNTKSYSFEVVGICERVNYLLEEYECPGYMAFTRNVEDCDKFITFLDSKKIKDAPFYFDEINNKLHSSFVMSINVKLIAYSGSTNDRGVNRLINTFALILCLLIAFGTISLIYNSFSISISDRTKMFGVLKSIGATKRQIRFSVIFEALVLSVVAIPFGLILGCIGIGTTLWALKDSFNGWMGVDSSVPMMIVLNPGILLLASLLCIITAFISAWIPARKAVKITAIEAIRQNDSTKIDSIIIVPSPNFNKLFGFEGSLALKNFRRNKRKYKSVIFSLATSIVLFIGALSFCNNLIQDTRIVLVSDDGIDMTFYYPSADLTKIPDIQNIIDSDKYVTKQYYSIEFGEFIKLPKEYINEELLDILKNNGADDLWDNMYVDVYFLEDKYFDSYCKKIKLDPMLFKDISDPKGILYNNGSNHFELEDRGFWYSGAFLDDGIIDEKVNLLESEKSIKIGAISKEHFIEGYDSQLSFFFPFSMIRNVLIEKTDDYETCLSFSIMSKKPQKTYENLKKVLSEAGYSTQDFINKREYMNSRRMLANIILVFSMGFIIIISLICMANVFNTISTNIMLRRREFAVLKSIGLSNKGFKKILNYECLIFGIKSLWHGLICGLLVSVLIYLSMSDLVFTRFYAPLAGMLISIVFVFLIVFGTMIYSSNKLNDKNIIDEIKNENI